MWRCKPAHSCRPTQDRMGKCGARCGAGSRTLAFLAPLVWHHGFKCSRPTRGRRGNPRCGDATQSSSLVDYDKLRQGRGLSVGVADFGTSSVEYMCSPALRTCGCECRVCVHASSCHGHVFAHASMRVRVSHFRSPLPSQMQRKLRNYRRTSQSCPVQARCR